LMMETTEVSETSVNKNLTPGKYPKESTLHSQHGESLKTTSILLTYIQLECQAVFKTALIVAICCMLKPVSHCR
jgi:hypothetical protein